MDDLYLNTKYGPGELDVSETMINGEPVMKLNINFADDGYTYLTTAEAIALLEYITNFLRSK